eukprot:COSAG02_NODE_16043_length_1118_cov_1.244357_2_plen_93_part_00
MVVRAMSARQFGVGVVLWYSAQVVSSVFSDSLCSKMQCIMHAGVRATTARGGRSTHFTGDDRGARASVDRRDVTLLTGVPQLLAPTAISLSR